MIPCNEIRSQIAFHLDRELHEREESAFKSHLVDCPDCSKALENESTFINSVRNAGPLYPAPDELHSRVRDTLKDSEGPITAPPELHARIRRSLSMSHPMGDTPSGNRRRLVVAAAFVLMVAMWGLISSFHRPVDPPPPVSDFAFMAVDTHLRHLRGQLPLEVNSGSPEVISDWFEGKVSFSVTLPNYQEVSGQEKLYTLEGARLVGYKNDYAALVAYRMFQRPISLVVTSNMVALPSGGQEIASRDIKFHHNTLDGLNVITWSHRGLTYALVSDLDAGGQQSCMVCHAGATDRDFIDLSLKDF